MSIRYYDRTTGNGRRLFGVAALFAVLSAGCDDQPLNPPTTGSFTVQATGDPANRLDTVRVIAVGPQTRSALLSPSGSGGFSGVVDELPPGTYRVVVEGLVAGEVAYLGTDSGAVVTAGQSTAATVPLAPFVPTLNVVPDFSFETRFPVAWGTVAGADSYRVEVDRSPAFSNPIPLTTVRTDALVTLPDSGVFHVRIRARNTLVSPGRASAARSTRIVVDAAEPGDNTPAGATNLGFVGAGRMYSNRNILPAGDQDWFSVGVCEGDTLWVQVTAGQQDPSSPLTAALQIVNPGGAVVAAGEGVGVTDPAAWLPVTRGGRYRVRVSGVRRTTGHYALAVRVLAGPRTGCPSPAVTRVVVNPDNAGVTVRGTTQTFTALPQDPTGAPIGGRTVSWSSSNAAVATIGGSSGVANAVMSGQTVIAATVDGVTGYALMNVALPGALPVGTWTQLTNGASQPLHSIWGASPAPLQMYGVGPHGAFLRFDGTSWSELPGGLSQDLNRVWGLGPWEVYAVGSGGGILRYDGANLTAMASGTTRPLYGIWGTSPTDLFAVGAVGLILHFDGSEWREMTSPTSQTLNAVWGVGRDQVFAVGASGTILRFDGHTWALTPTPTNQALHDVWGLTPTDLWAVGEGGTILRFNGTSWSNMTAGGVAARLTTIWGTSSSDVYAVGDGGTILRFNGTTWGMMASPTGQDLTGLWGWSSGNVYVAGAAGMIARGLRGTSPPAAWIGVTPNAADAGPPGATATFAAQAFDAGGNAIAGKSVLWSSRNPNVATVDPVSGIATATGGGQAVIEATADGVSGYALLTAADGDAIPVGRWTGLPPATNQTLRGIWGVDGSNVFAVGAAGAALRYDGMTWRTMASVTTQALNSIGGTSGSDVFAVGAGGTAVHYDGARWRALASGTSQELFGVWAGSPVDVFAVGDGGTILRYDGTTWSEMASGTTQSLRAVWGTSRANVFAVGAGGTILRFDGTVWSPMLSGVSTALLGVWGTAANDVFAVGEGGTILHYQNSTWAPMSAGTMSTLTAIWGSSGTDVYAVGSGGTILRYHASRWTPESRPVWANFLGAWGASATALYLVGEGGTTVLGTRGAARIVVSPSGATIPGPGATQPFTAQAFDADGNLMVDKSFGWSELNSSVIDVSSSGLATARASGQATITASTDGVSGYALATVVPSTASTPVRMWSTVPSPTNQPLRGIWGTSPTNVFAVGAGGTVINWDGATWTPMSSGTTAPLRGVWGPSATHTFAIGITHAKLRYDGSRWENVPLFPTPELYAIWGSSPDMIYAVGDSGTILRWDGWAWARQVSNTTQNLRAVWGTSADNVFAVGAGGVIVHFDDARWLPVQNGGSGPALNAIWGTSPTDVYAVGASGTILHWDGVTWTATASGTTQNLNGIYGSSPSDVYVVGDGGTILHYDGSTWTAMSSGVGMSDLFAAWGTLSSTVWAVGAGGTILRGDR
ncbi:MAG: Ig-like domain-containing protein [Gemmatimonadetes bacterium]|nr:Ig-like domain-containing protein [Gemmatimonadota bacterium]